MALVVGSGAFRRMKSLHSLLAVILIGALPGLMLGGSARALVVEQVQEQRYAVALQPGQKLREALNAATPVREQGRPFHGRTQWGLRSGYGWQRVEGGERCALTEVRVLLEAHIVLPELKPLPGPEAEAAFERYLAALRVHKQGHLDIVREAAQRIDEQLAKLDAQPSCEQLERLARRITAAQLEQARREGERYDQLTGHGCTQGACLR